MRSNQAVPKSLSERMVQSLQERIVAGEYGPGTWLPSERELSAEFSADRSIVRGVLVHLELAGLITRERGHRPRVRPQDVAYAAKDIGAAEVTPARRVAVVLPQHVTDDASREILKGLNETLQAQVIKSRLIIFDTNMHSATCRTLEEEACAAVEAEDMDGAVVWPSLEEGLTARWHRLARMGRPVIFVDRYDAALPCDFVGIDNYVAAREATEYLLGLGHARIAHITNDEPASPVVDRAAGYRDALRAANIIGETATPWVIPKGNAAQWMNDFVTHCLEASTPPTAVFAVNDFLAHKLIALLEERSARVPEQISVLGFDDSDRYSARPPLLTTVRQPFERIGQRAAALLLLRLTSRGQTPQTFQHILLPTYLIERRTCQSLKKP